jgi:hypothetical protein
VATVRRVGRSLLSFGKWLTPAGFVALLGVAGSLGVAWVQVTANRDAANQRARVERSELAAQADAQLQLAAVSVVLDAPSCDSAVARATLASAVLGRKLPSNFVDRVEKVRAVSFPAFVLVPTGGIAANFNATSGAAYGSAFAPGWTKQGVVAAWGQYSGTYLGLLREAQRHYLDELRKASAKRTISCSALSKG